MILQSLKKYYERKALDPESGIAPEGFEYKEIPFLLVIDKDGMLVNIEDTRQMINKKLRARSFLVPKAEIKSSNVKANLLWGTMEYVLGLCKKKDYKSDLEKWKHEERVKLQKKSFIDLITNLNVREDEGISAIISFLNSDYLSRLAQLETFSIIQEMNPFISFRLNNDTCLVCERKSVIDKIKKIDLLDSNSAFCLISGRNDIPARLQPDIKGVRNAKPTGAKIVSFNLKSSNSFKKEQGDNAPMGVTSSFEYTTALNQLLSKDSNQKIFLGDATIVFWSQEKEKLEDDFGDFFVEPYKDNPDQYTEKVKSLLCSVASGKYPVNNEESQFYILGLSPNSARISIRFWIVGSLREISSRIVNYFEELEIIHGPSAPNFMPLSRLLRSIAPLRKSENIPPNLAGDMIRSILSGSPYPETLLHASIRRIRSERKVDYEHASIIKSYLNRKRRFYQLNEEELKVSLDRSNHNIGYLCGRLFSVLEKIQEESSPLVNSKIRDRYYSSASGTPGAVFPRLMKLKNYHQAKLNIARQIMLDKLISEIIACISYDGFPSTLSLADQGRFAIGYYHQRQDFFQKKDCSNQVEEVN
jgi:CRISPR-associated protein Csd1